MPRLPSILELPRFTDAAHGITFFWPSVENGGIEILHTEDTPSSPRPRIMSLRKLRMKPRTAIPVHVHYKAEKMYIGLCLGTPLTIAVWGEDGVSRSYNLNNLSQRVIVQPGRPHALIFTGDHPAEFLVIKTSQDPEDIHWEEDAKVLLKNEHLTRK